MSKFSGVLSFAEKHPVISLMMVSTVVSGVVNFTRAVMSPFAKAPACQINFGDLVNKALADQVKKHEAEESMKEEASKVVEINPDLILVETGAEVE